MQSPIETQISWLISFKERQEKADGEDANKVEEVESLAEVSDKEEVVEEELVCESSRLFCSSPSSQLARQLHSTNKLSKLRKCGNKSLGC